MKNFIFIFLFFIFYFFKNVFHSNISLGVVFWRHQIYKIFLNAYKAIAVQKIKPMNKESYFKKDDDMFVFKIKTWKRRLIFNKPYHCCDKIYRVTKQFFSKFYYLFLSGTLKEEILIYFWFIILHLFFGQALHNA